MTKKKNIASKLVLVLFVLTLISCCLLGSTFARYVSSGSGSASISIAKWDIDITGGGTGGSTTVTFGDLSPSDDESMPDVSTARSNSSGKILVASLTNNGEVDAEVSFAVTGGKDYTLVAGSDFGSGMHWNGSEITGTPSKAEQVDKLFSVNLYYGTTGDPANTSTMPSNSVSLKVKASVYLFVEVVWTSGDLWADSVGVADAIDTWVGENVTNILIDVNYTAVQASQQPVT